MTERPPSSPPHDYGAEHHHTSLLQTIRQWLKGVGRNSNGDSSWREAVEEAIEDLDEDAVQIDEHERVLLANLLAFGEQTVEDVMLPRPDIVAIKERATLEELLALVKDKGHSRLPIYRTSLDDVLGLVHIRDVLGQMASAESFRLKDLVRPILFVPPSMRVIDLLVKMRDSRIHMAVVVDGVRGYRRSGDDRGYCRGDRWGDRRRT